jgi:toxin ParE1/3/4
VRIRFTKEAVRDRDAIKRYLRARNLDAARQVSAAITAAARPIARYPESGRPGADYILVYRVENDTAIVYRIFHAAQDR